MWIWKFKKIVSQSNCGLTVRNLSSKSALICKINKELYLRQYPTIVVEPDGSSYTIRHYEPCRIIKLPFDIKKASEEERAIILENRKPKKKVVLEEEVVVDFDSKKYLKYLKKRA